MCQVPQLTCWSKNKRKYHNSNQTETIRIDFIKNEKLYAVDSQSEVPVLTKIASFFK